MALVALLVGVAPGAHGAERQRRSLLFPHAVLLHEQARSDPRALLSGTLEGSGFGSATVVAFEDHELFTYLAGAAVSDNIGEDRNGSARLLRRLLVLKPHTFVIEDQIQPDGDGISGWRMQFHGVPNVSGHTASIMEDNGRWDITALLPEGTVIRSSAAKRQANGHRLRIGPRRGASSGRFVQVLDARRSDEVLPPVSAEFAADRRELTVGFSGGTAKVTLPGAQPGAAGYIEILGRDGRDLLPRRLLPSGVLPHGADGRRLLERWDSAYRTGGSAPWNTGRPSSELKRLVDQGTLKPGRAIELGCGTGTTSIYLAKSGFSVSAIDIAPTALRRAERTAAQAGAQVQWILADVLAVPNLAPFDLVFDRGCYHGVRRQNAAAYVETLKRLTRPGSRVLILAGNANESKPHYGPPRVAEAELRQDFAGAFEIELLREIRFDTSDPANDGALAWSILLRRKSP